MCPNMRTVTRALEKIPPSFVKCIASGPLITDTYLEFAQGGGRISEGVQGNPFYERNKNRKKRKQFELGPHPDSYRGPSDFQFWPRGLQRSPKGPFCSSSGVLCSFTDPWYPKEPHWPLI